MLTHIAVLALLGIQHALAAPSSPSQSSYIDWRTFTARGVNLGGWLLQEAVIDPVFWATYSGGAVDEWTMCVNLGKRCGPVLEQRYATYIQRSDIDRLAAAGINLLRIPTGYNAWVKVPGSQLYTGRQVEHLRSIADYAIKKHGMHIIIDIHSLPGGINGKEIGERDGAFGWYNNQTALEYSYRAVDAALAFIQSSGHPQAFTLEPINEPVDNRDPSTFGTPTALSDAGAAGVLAYFRGVLDRVRRVNPNMPVMLQDGFRGEAYWSSFFSNNNNNNTTTSKPNIVFDVHNYYFAGRPTTSENLPQFLCADAKASVGDGEFPVFVGEWSVQAVANNTFASRAGNLNAGLRAWEEHTRGSAYWTYRFFGNVSVGGEGVQGDYWSFETFMGMGGIDSSKGVSCV